MSEAIGAYDLVIRGQRILTTAGLAATRSWHPRRHHRRHRTPGQRPDGQRGHRTRRRRNPHPRPGGHPRPRQRARPHRVGRLRLRHPRRSCRWRDHHHRHAAEQHPAHHQRGRPGAEARGRQGPGVRGRRILGRCHPGQQERPPPAARRRRLRLQVLPPALRRGRVPAPRCGRDGRGHGRAQVLRLPHDRARRGLPRDRPRTRTPAATTTKPSWPPAPAAPRTRPSPRSSNAPAGPAPAPTSCTSPPRTRCR